MIKRSSKTALITGASGGIGYELALCCAKDGINLILVARDKEKLEAIKKDLEVKHGLQVTTISTDLSVPGHAKILYDYCITKELSIDYLINNAGFGDYKKVADADPATLTGMLNLNIIALTELTALFVKDMVKRGSGRILNVGSTAAYQPVPRLAVYAASKSYVVSFTESLHAELKNTGVTATVLSPGVTATSFFDRAEMHNSATVQGKQADPAKVASAGYQAMLKGDLYVIPGFMNRLLAFGSQIMPSRHLILALAGIINRENPGQA